MADGGHLLQVERLRTWLASGDAVVRAVDGVSFSLEQNQTFALLGESGCGKSMTALSLMRLLPENGRIVSGSVRLHGQDLTALPEVAMRGVRGRQIGMIFQEPMLSLNPVMPVGEQIAEVLHRHGPVEGRRAVRGRVAELLRAVGIPDAAHRFDAYPFQLSGGMKQRVMIAMSLAGKPDLLIADEPTTALDVTIQAQVLQLMRDLQAASGMSILLITHDLGVVAEMAHRVAVMYAGEIVELADRERFFGAPFHPYSRKLFAALPGWGKRTQKLEVIGGSVPSLTGTFRGCRFAPRCDLVWGLCHEAVPPWREVSPGQWARCHLTEGRRAAPAVAPAGLREAAPVPVAAAGEALLRVEDLRVHFPVHKGVFKRVAALVKAVDGVSLSIQRGRTLALVGESGCGKTTVAKGILQLIRPSGGRVYFAGTELTTLKRSTLRRRRGEFQFIFQDPYASLNPRMPIADIIEEGMVALGVGASKEERHRRIDDILAQVGLSAEARQRYPHEFSGGQRQRVAIARALAVGPKLIICDEPTSALDVSVQAQILNLLKRLQDELGLTYLFITHNLSVVEYLAHDVAVMYLGRIVEQGSAPEVLGRPAHPYTRALLSAVPVIERAAGRPVMRLQGDPPSPLAPPPGCHFHPRCPEALPICSGTEPPLVQISPTHGTRCHLHGPGIS